MLVRVMDVLGPAGFIALLFTTVLPFVCVVAMVPFPN